MKVLLRQLYLAKKTRAKRKFIKEERCRNAFAFQIFLTHRNFIFAEYLTARFSWWSNIILDGGFGTKFNPLTIVTSKKLLPVYDEPMLFYQLSTLIVAVIKLP